MVWPTSLGSRTAEEQNGLGFVAAPAAAAAAADSDDDDNRVIQDRPQDFG